MPVGDWAESATNSVVVELMDRLDRGGSRGIHLICTELAVSGSSTLRGNKPVAGCTHKYAPPSANREGKSCELTQCLCVNTNPGAI
jgi:hypothetical protein